MLKLKNVSKFYYSNGLVASGFSKINLDLNIGEFVVITGESGSGKSTLLNVISGLDTYEEGEMYINGEETSYYSENDFEEYRKKYVANIFQNFNLINSYTVYQNIELIYILNNLNNSEMPSKIDDLINEVGLSKYKNTKVSKLSGGQKQRVAIARALAKDTPIIVADEPTGNLDSRSAKEIIKLLYEISKNKLVIIVTHNYEQVEEYATRKIRMHDGKILEDRVIVKQKNIKYEEKEYGNANFIDRFKLAFRNTFNILPKFLLLLGVYLLLSLAVMGEYSSNLKSDYDTSLFGFNNFFHNTDDKRIVVKKKDNSLIEESDIEKIESIDTIDYVVLNDVLLDTDINLEGDGDVYLYGKLESIDYYKGDLDYGVMPKEDNEIIISLYKDYYIKDVESLINKEFKIYNSERGGELLFYKLKVSGVKIVDNMNSFDSVVKIYGTKGLLDDCNKGINRNYSDMDITIHKSTFKTENGYSRLEIMPSKKVSKGKAIVSEDVLYVCNNYNCINNNLKIDIHNIYFNSSLDLKISNTFNKKNIESRTGYKDFDMYSNYIFINDDEYYSLFDKGPYQVSAFLSDVKKAKNTTERLENMGFETLRIKDNLVDLEEELRVFINLFKIIFIVIVLVALFFISYFVIKIILKSRNSYYSIVRMLGASKTDVKSLINIELNLVLNIAYLLIITCVILVTTKVLNIEFVKDLVTYLKFTDYVILYVILFIMSFLIARRYSRALFKKSAMNAYKEV